MPCRARSGAREAQGLLRAPRHVRVLSSNPRITARARARLHSVVSPVRSLLAGRTTSVSDRRRARPADPRARPPCYPTHRVPLACARANSRRVLRPEQVRAKSTLNPKHPAHNTPGRLTLCVFTTCSKIRETLNNL